MAHWLKASGLALACLFALSACKQGEGEVCQVNTDCEVGLTCNSTTGLCQRTTSSVDAGVSDETLSEEAPDKAAGQAGPDESL